MRVEQYERRRGRRLLPDGALFVAVYFTAIAAVSSGLTVAGAASTIVYIVAALLAARPIVLEAQPALIMVLSAARALGLDEPDIRPWRSLFSPDRRTLAGGWGFAVLALAAATSLTGDAAWAALAFASGPIVALIAAYKDIRKFRTCVVFELRRVADAEPARLQRAVRSRLEESRTELRLLEADLIEREAELDQLQQAARPSSVEELGALFSMETARRRGSEEQDRRRSNVQFWASTALGFVGGLASSQVPRLW
jgi:hypothetical protein